MRGSNPLRAARIINLITNQIMRKIPLVVIEEQITKEAVKIHALDSKKLPEVLAEIQGTEARYMARLEHKDVDHRLITHVRLVSVIDVLTCWYVDDASDEWFERLNMEAVEV